MSQLVGLNVDIAIQTMKADLYDDFSKGSCYRKEEAYINHESQSDVRLRRLESECTEYTNKYDTATAERKKAYEKKDALRIKVIERYQKLPKWWDTAEALGDAMDDVKAKSSKTKKKWVFVKQCG